VEQDGRAGQRVQQRILDDAGHDRIDRGARWQRGGEREP
jgi:hypothetical protein